MIRDVAGCSLAVVGHDVHTLLELFYLLRSSLKLLPILLLCVFITHFEVWPQIVGLVQRHTMKCVRNHLVLIRLVIARPARAVYIIMILYRVVRCPEVVVVELVMHRLLSVA